MILNTGGNKPIYIQIADWIESEILNGNLKEDEKVYSQYKLADMFNINPATAAKGLTRLAEEGVLYDKRGLGKFVAAKAKVIITDRRKNQTLKQLMEEIIQEGNRLHLSEDELIDLLKEVKRQGEN
ncbi:GntR family transcriptional regulator [Halobacillus rhizosphaerae]